MINEDDQEARYDDAIAHYGPAIERLARAYEFDPDERRDLVQDIHVALWRSFRNFDGRCSVGTWTYRVAHNVAVSHAVRRKRLRPARLASLEELSEAQGPDDPETDAGQRQVVDRLTALIQALKAPDRQVMMLYLEDLSAAEIAEVTGLSPGAVAVKIHRLKALLARRFHQGGSE